jgi:hypothetical protein
MRKRFIGPFQTKESYKRRGRWLMANRSSKLKYGAKTRNLAWELNKEFVREQLLGRCIYCNIEGTEESPNGIDRIDNSVGYTSENSKSCCSMCNQMKHSYSKEDFLNQCEKIVLNRTLK